MRDRRIIHHADELLDAILAALDSGRDRALAAAELHRLFADLSGTVAGLLPTALGDLVHFHRRRLAALPGHLPLPRGEIAPLRSAVVAIRRLVEVAEDGDGSELQREAPPGRIGGAIAPGLIAEFLAQAHQQLEEWERWSLALDEDPGRAVPALRRIIHTFKGDLGILEQEQAALICHGLESRVGPGATDLLLAGRDHLARLLDHLAGTADRPDPGALAALAADGASDWTPLPGTERVVPGSDAIEAEGPGPAAATATSEDAAAWSPADDPDLASEFVGDVEDLAVEIETLLDRLRERPGDRAGIDACFRAFHTIKGLAATFGIARMVEATDRAEDLLDAIRSDIRPLDGRALDLMQRLVDLVRRQVAGFRARTPTGAATTRLSRELHAGIDAAMDAGPTPRESAPLAVAPVPVEEPAARGDAPGPMPSNVRVRADRLDLLLDLVGELSCDVAPDKATATGQRANVARELQSVVTRLRLVPLGPVFERMERVARRVARQLGKLLAVELTGAETELDKSLVDQVGDVLVHLVNNAVDHGLEPPGEREAAGKARTGRLRLAAEHVGGRVLITVEDDGAGLDPQLIRRRAIELGLIADAAEPDHDDLVALLFASGFSTRRAATTVSGRGVGLDAVANQIERLQGTIAVRSQPGRGCRFELSMPLTLAIIDTIQLVAGGISFLLPTTTVRATLRPGEVQPAPGIDHRRYAHYRGEILVVVPLGSSLGLETASPATDPVLVLIEDGDHRVLIEVDAVVGQQQVVIKNLGPLLRRIPCVSGGAVLGAGHLGYVLNQGTLVRIARGEAPASEEIPDMNDAQPGTGDQGAHLVFLIAGERFAVPANLVQEIIPYQPLTPLPQAPAHVHGVVNLRGQVIPVMDLRLRLQVATTGDRTRPCIVVLALRVEGETARIGILVDDAVDLLEVGGDELLPVPVLAQTEGEGRCLAGLARSGEHLVMLLDLVALFRGRPLTLDATRALAERLAGTPVEDKP